MTIHLSRFRLARSLVFCAAALGIAVLAGCEGGLGGKAALPEWKNPFATAQKAPPGGDLAGTPKTAGAAKNAKSQPSKVGPDFAEGLMQGRQLERAGKLNEARESYQNLIVKYPDRYEPYHRLGVVADRQKRFREAVALYSQALAIHPDAEIFNDLGYCYYLQGQLDKAESAMLKSVSMKPANPRFRNNLAMVYGHQGRLDDAMEQFRRGGSEADAYYNMAFILAARDDVQGAKNCLVLAQAADPTHEKAREALLSFEEADKEKGPADPRTTVVKDGRRWERFREGQQPDATLAQAAKKASYDGPTADESAAGSPDATAPRGDAATRADTQTLLRRARSMMSERMADRGPVQR